MKKLTGVLAIALIALVYTLPSCKKTENKAPVIVLDEPADGETIAITDSLHIEGTASDDDELHEMSILITSHMGDTVFAQYPTVHAMKTYTFHYHFHPADTGMFHLHVAAEDHEDGLTTKEVMFNVTP